MVRDIQVTGECIVRVKGNPKGPLGSAALANAGNSSNPDAFGLSVTAGGLLASGTTSYPWELGLSAEAIIISPHFVHTPVKTDDYGDKIPAELLWMLADATVRMKLIHFDWTVLDACVAEATGGLADFSTTFDGTLAGAGLPMGGGASLFNGANHYVSLTIMPAASQAAVTAGGSPPIFGPGRPWRFRTCYLLDRVVIPVGTEKSVVELTWRAVPYSPLPQVAPLDFSSSTKVLWDHLADASS